MKINKFNRKYETFSKLSPRKQRDEFIRLRWKILKDTPYYGGLFTSHLVLNEPGRPKIFSQDFDFLFLGTDGRTIWNAEIITARRAFRDKIDRIAWDRATSLMSEEEREQEFRWDFVPVFVGIEKFYALRMGEKRRYDFFGGLTFREYEDNLKKQILESEPPAVYENYRLDRSFRYGIGLRMVVDADWIDRDVIESAIHRFRKVGEQEWQSANPVPCERLPSLTEEEELKLFKAMQAADPSAIDKF